MKYFAVALVSAFVAVDARVERELRQTRGGTDQALALFLEHIQEYDLQFNSQAEFHNALMNFKETLRRVTEIACPEGIRCSSVPKLNAFATYSDEMFNQMKGYLMPPPPERDDEQEDQDHGGRTLNNDLLNQGIDWRTRNGTPFMTGQVDNQGNCGSCWTFGSLHAMEAAIALKTNSDIVKLSRDQLMDCTHNKDQEFLKNEFGFAEKQTLNLGCKGGYVLYSHDFLVAQGVPTAAEFKYEPREGPECTSRETCGCKHGEKNTKSKLSGYKSLSPYDRDRRGWFGDAAEIRQALESGPLSIAIQTSQEFYSAWENEGIIDENWKNSSCHINLNEGENIMIDHAITLVGYQPAVTKRQSRSLQGDIKSVAKPRCQNASQDEVDAQQCIEERDSEWDWFFRFNKKGAGKCCPREKEDETEPKLPNCKKATKKEIDKQECFAKNKRFPEWDWELEEFYRNRFDDYIWRCCPVEKEQEEDNDEEDIDDGINEEEDIDDGINEEEDIDDGINEEEEQGEGEIDVFDGEVDNGDNEEGELIVISPAYWIIMNSWGTGWGDGGFAKVPFVEDDVGYCGMYTQVYQPLA